MISRRKLLLGGAGAAAAAAWLRPVDHGGPYPPYFAELNRTLRQHNIDKPSLVIDMDRLDRNIDRVAAACGGDVPKTYRVVAKSIPSPQLVQYVAQRAGTQALMVFHRPFIEAMAAAMPESNILMGKPMPVVAAETFYRNHNGIFRPQHQLQWLIDTPARLQQYLHLAQAQGLQLQVNLELDVGLHRGGFSADAELAQALTLIRNNPQQLRFAGFMGYDAHLMGIPGFMVDGELPKVKQRYADCVALLQRDFADLQHDDCCFNGAGSPTFRYYQGQESVNDLSAGSCLMKPSHYDLPILEDFEPSAFIASPVLKKLQGGRLPALEWAGPLLRGWDVNQRHIYFGYSGNWLAVPEAPPGLSPHFAYISSNQQGYAASPSVVLGVDDFIFLRPSQSEAVMLQFGDLVMVRGQRVVARWPVLPGEVAA